MRDAILGWLGFLMVAGVLVHGCTRPHSPSQAQVLAERQRAAELDQTRRDNARIACASGVLRACGQ